MKLRRVDPLPPGEQRLAYSIAEAGQLLGLGQASTERLVALGRLPSVKIGRRRLVPAVALRRLIEEGSPIPLNPTPRSQRFPALERPTAGRKRGAHG